jgi:hypothetical protein
MSKDRKDFLSTNLKIKNLYSILFIINIKIDKFNIIYKKNMVNQRDGQIFVESECGKVSIFYFNIR